MKCYICEKGSLVKKRINYSVSGVYIGKFNAEVCTICKEKFFDEKVSRKITQKTKELGVWSSETKRLQ